MKILFSQYSLKLTCNSGYCDRLLVVQDLCWTDPRVDKTKANQLKRCSEENFFWLKMNLTITFGSTLEWLRVQPLLWCFVMVRPRTGHVTPYLPIPPRIIELNLLKVKMASLGYPKCAKPISKCLLPLTNLLVVVFFVSLCDLPPKILFQRFWR